MSEREINESHMANGRSWECSYCDEHVSARTRVAEQRRHIDGRCIVALHPNCTPRKPRTCGGTFVCEVCLRRVGWCFGGSDEINEVAEVCDACWSAIDSSRRGVLRITPKFWTPSALNRAAVILPKVRALIAKNARVEAQRRASKPRRAPNFS